MLPRVGLLAVGVGLLLVSCSSSSSRTPGAGTTVSSPAVRVTLDRHGCAPTTIRTSPGLTTFAVANRSGGAGSFAVLSGEHVVGQVTGLARGAGTSMRLTLAGGAYRTACDAGGIQSGGTVLVGADAQAPTLSQPADLLAAAGTYRSYLLDQTRQLVAAVSGLDDALARGAMADARSRYLAARLLYARVEVAAANFGAVDLAGRPDLDARIEPPAGGGGGGFPAIAAALWGGSSLGVDRVGARLSSDVRALQTRLGASHLDVVTAAGADATRLGDLVGTALEGAMEPASHFDLVDVQGVVDGTAALLDAVRAPLRRRDAALDAQATARLSHVQALLDRLRTPAGYPTTDHIGPVDRRSLAAALDAAADSVSRVGSALSRPEPS